MQHTLNQVSLQGRAGAPTVRLSRDGPVFASVLLTVEDVPDTDVLVAGIGLEAAGIACLKRGDLLRAEGRFARDPESGELYVQATAVARLLVRGTSVQAVAPSVDELDRLAALLPSS